MTSKYFEITDLYFSELFGKGIYLYSGECEVLGKNGKTAVFENVVNHEKVFAEKYEITEAMTETVRKLILHPPCSQVMEWPCDLIHLQESQSAGGNVYVRTVHTDDVVDPDSRKAEYLLLFHMHNIEKMTSVAEQLKLTQGFNLNHANTRRIIKGILQIVSAFNQSGYVFYDFDLNDFLINGNGQLCVTFSDLLYPMDGSVRATKREEYSDEFADPALYNRQKQIVDAESQNYSLCAVLFYLMFGVHPYEGRLKIGNNGNNYYYKMPIFIFDPEDQSNALGAFAEDEQIITLWKECPENFRDVFIHCLGKSNAEQVHKTYGFSADQWLQLLKKEGWKDE